MKNDKDTIIQVDWTWQTGSHAGKTLHKRWAYFQEGTVVTGIKHSTPGTTVIARYSSNGDVAASISSYGKGVVAVSGVHVEADQSWCKYFTPIPVRVVITDMMGMFLVQMMIFRV